MKGSGNSEMSRDNELWWPLAKAIRKFLEIPIGLLAVPLAFRRTLAQKLNLLGLDFQVFAS